MSREQVNKPGPRLSPQWTGINKIHCTNTASLLAHKDKKYIHTIYAIWGWLSSNDSRPSYQIPRVHIMVIAPLTLAFLISCFMLYIEVVCWLQVSGKGRDRVVKCEKSFPLMTMKKLCLLLSKLSLPPSFPLCLSLHPSLLLFSVCCVFVLPSFPPLHYLLSLPPSFPPLLVLPVLCN